MVLLLSVVVQRCPVHFSGPTFHSDRISDVQASHPEVRDAQARSRQSRWSRRSHARRRRKGERRSKDNFYANFASTFHNTEDVELLPSIIKHEGKELE
jgi:hypothetical protein